MACSVKKGLANWGIGTAFCKAGIDYGVQGVIKALPLRKKQYLWHKRQCLRIRRSEKVLTVGEKGMTFTKEALPLKKQALLLFKKTLPAVK